MLVNYGENSSGSFCSDKDAKTSVLIRGKSSFMDLDEQILANLYVSLIYVYYKHLIEPNDHIELRHARTLSKLNTPNGLDPGNSRTNE